jgi:two-component system, OmpR family, phosphate regulon sensor histidine kinase PhoR
MSAVPAAFRRFLAGLALWLAAGASVGWLYGNPERGLLVAALVALAWQVRHLLKFEQALRTQDFAYLRYGEGIWPALFARYWHLKERNRRHKQNYRRLLKEVRNSANAIPDGGIVLNESMEILLCNPAAEKLAGFDARKDRGQRVDNILRDPAFARYINSDDYEAGVEVPSPHREDEWLYCRIVPYGAGQKLLLIRDITERKRLARMRRDFVANASHELRSPLTVLSGYLDALVNDPEAPQQWRKPLGQMHAQSARMARIVGDLLELSRLEATEPDAGDEIVHVSQLLAAAVPEDGGAGPQIVVQSESQAALRGNAAEIETVVSNLLSNAVRHTPPGGSVRLRWLDSESGGATLAVEDTGEGIAEEFIPRLTERFFRVDRGRSRDDGGTGLGLAIVKHILTRHDAELEIRSTPGEGSRFLCHFPERRVIREQPLPAANASGTPRPRLAAR